jgi:hypothetical protein
VGGGYGNAWSTPISPYSAISPYSPFGSLLRLAATSCKALVREIRCVRGEQIRYRCRTSRGPRRRGSPRERPGAPLEAALRADPYSTPLIILQISLTDAVRRIADRDVSELERHRRIAWRLERNWFGRDREVGLAVLDREVSAA